MLTATTVMVLVLAGLIALTAPLLYITYLSHTDESHSPRAGQVESEPAD